MTEAPDLDTIINCLIAATGPDRDLDLAIGALWSEPRPFDLSVKQNRGMKPTVYPFTGSMDSAMALKRKLAGDVRFSLRGPLAKGGYRCTVGDNVGLYAPTEALAICLASICTISSRGH